MRPRRLLPHQRRGLKWACSKPDQKLPILWEMRLGKTLLTIRWVERMRHLPALIVCPKSVVPVWVDELSQEGRKAIIIADKNDADEISMYDPFRGRVHLIHYERLRLSPEIARQPWAAVVLDESPVIKSPTSKISKLCTSAFRHVPARAILTGYPTPSGLQDIYQQYLFLFGQFLGHRHYWTFRKEYYEKHFLGFGWQPRAGTNTLIKQAIDHEATVLRRKDVGLGSTVFRQTRWCELPAVHASAYRKVEKEWVHGFSGDETKWKVVVDQWLRQIANGPHKDELLFELLDGELATDKVVVWFNYRDDIVRVRGLLKRRGRPFVEVHGGVPAPDRRTAMNRFRRPGATVLLGTPASAKYGLDFSAADTAIYYSLGYDTEHYEQSKNRIIHPKKKAPVSLIHLLVRDTIEEDVYATLSEKLNEAGLSMRPLWDVAAARRALS